MHRYEIVESELRTDMFDLSYQYEPIFQQAELSHLFEKMPQKREIRDLQSPTAVAEKTQSTLTRR